MTNQENVRESLAQRALQALQSRSRSMTLEEIEAEIQAVRKARM